MLLDFLRPGQTEVPGQRVLKDTCLRPGRKVDLVMEDESAGGPAATVSTILHGLDGKKRLVLAQPDPPVNPSLVGRELEVTFLARYQELPGGGWLRVGYRGPLLAMVEDYPLAQGLKQPVLILAGPKRLAPYTLRRSQRLSPPRDGSLGLFLLPRREPLELIDFSRGGASFRLPRGLALAEESSLSLLLLAGSEELTLSARVTRVPEDSEGRVAVRFDGLPAPLAERLAGLLAGLAKPA